MLDKFIRTEEVCLTLGVPTALGWLILVVLVVLSAILFWRSKK